MKRLWINALHYYVNFILVAFVHSAISSIVRNPALDEQTRQILMRHNFYRQIHDSKPLTLDEKLCEEALELAQSMAEMDQPLIASGINVFSDKLDREAGYLNPVDSWYQEVLFYQDEETKGLTRNFTQMVWKASQKLGVGIARSESGTFYFVCKYDPPGNIDDAYELNVFKRGGDDYSNHEAAVRTNLRLHQVPYFEEPKTNFAVANDHVVFDTTDYPARGMDTIVDILPPNTTSTTSASSLVQPKRRNRGRHSRIAWWLIFENVARTLEEELKHFVWPESDVTHSIEKRDTYTNNIPLSENVVDDTLLSSLLQSVGSEDTVARQQNDHLVEPVAKIVGECCEDEKDSSVEDHLTKKCGCHQLEIVSRKVDMVLVFVVFNNIFLIIFGVAVTLGVVIQWCTNPGMNGRCR